MAYVKQTLWLVLLVVAGLILLPSTVEAQASSGKWIDRGLIEFNGENYYDLQPFDSTFNYKIDGRQSGDCLKEITLARSESRPVFDRATFKGPGTFADECTEREITLDTARANVVAYRRSADQIRAIFIRNSRVSGPGALYGIFNRLPPEDRTSQSTYFHAEANSDRPSRDDIVSTSPEFRICRKTRHDPREGFDGSVTERAIDDNIDGEDYTCLTGFRLINESETDRERADSAPGASLDNPQVDCDPGPLAWIVCATIDFVEGAVDRFAGYIENLLRINPLTTTTVDETEAESESAVFAVWKNIRNLANILLIPIFFALIFSQALSLNIDAYTVKKMLPRLVAAVILIQFSFFIMAIAVDISNVLGQGIKDLVLLPVQGEEIDIGFTAGSGLFAIGGLVLATIAVFSAGLFILLIPLVLAVIGVYLTLVFRHILIIVLAIMAPIAFAAWILPNTERVYKMWQDMLLKALMMYPLIMLLFAAGTIVAVIATGGNINDDEPARNLMALAAIIVPLGLVPATFRMGGAAISAFAGGLQRIQGAAGEKLTTPFRKRKERMGEERAARRAAAIRRTAAGTGKFGRSRLARGLASYSQFGLPITRGARTARAAALSQEINGEQKRLQEEGITEDYMLRAVAHYANEDEFNKYVSELRGAGKHSTADKVLAAKSQLARYKGNAAAQAAALKSVAAYGRAEESDFRSVHDVALAGNEFAQTFVMNDAAYAAKSQGKQFEYATISSAGGVFKPTDTEAVMDELGTYDWTQAKAKTVERLAPQLGTSITRLNERLATEGIPPEERAQLTTKLRKRAEALSALNSQWSSLSPKAKTAVDTAVQEIDATDTKFVTGIDERTGLPQYATKTVVDRDSQGNVTGRHEEEIGMGEYLRSLRDRGIRPGEEGELRSRDII